MLLIKQYSLLVILFSTKHNSVLPSVLYYLTSNTQYTHDIHYTELHISRIKQNLHHTLIQLLNTSNLTSTYILFLVHSHYSCAVLYVLKDSTSMPYHASRIPPLLSACADTRAQEAMSDTNADPPEYACSAPSGAHTSLS